MLTQFFFDDLNGLEYSKDPLREIYSIREQWKKLCREYRSYDGRCIDFHDFDDDQFRLLKLLPDIEAQNIPKFLDLMDGCDITAFRLFLVLGFDPNSEHDGRYMLEYAFDLSDDRFRETLYFFGADVNASDTSNTSLLQKMVRNGLECAAKWLIEKGARVNHINYPRETPLRDSLGWCKNFDITTMLIEKGAEDPKFYEYADSKGFLKDPEILRLFDQMTASDKEKFSVPIEMPEFVYVRL